MSTEREDDELASPAFIRRLAQVVAHRARFPERGFPFIVDDEASGSAEVRQRATECIQSDEMLDAELFSALNDLSMISPALTAFCGSMSHDPRFLPSWAEALAGFLESQPKTWDDFVPSELATARTSFGRAAEKILPRRDGLVLGIEVSDEGYRDICTALVQRLTEVCDQVLTLENELVGDAASAYWFDRPGFDMTRAVWLGRLEAFPALGFVLGVACQQWRDSVTEILARLSEDRDMLSTRLFCGEELGAITGFVHGAGDRHGDGRSVTLLRFASGRGVVYKPKDLRHVEATMGLIKFLNRADLTPTLATRDVICRDGYGWEERVEPEPVQDPKGFARYYVRLGMLMRLMQVLNGRDLWADNLVSCGEQPVIVDFECIFSPRAYPAPLLPPRRQVLVARMEATVLRTAMPLQASTPTPECPARDLGCLSHAGDQSRTDGSRLPLPQYRPWLDAEVADPWNYSEEICAGYRMMNDSLVASRDQLAGSDSPLSAFADLPVRYIWRGTSDYHRMIRESLSPVRLISRAARERLIAWPLREAFRSAHGDDRTDILEIARAEACAMRRLDVPLFTLTTTTRSLICPDGTEISNRFASAGWDEVLSRISELGHTSIESDIAILRTAMDAARGGSELRTAAQCAQVRHARRRTMGHRGEKGAPSVDEVTSAAQDIADLLYRARLPPLGAGVGWLSLQWSPLSDIWRVGLASADLLGGALGPALFFAEHFGLTGNMQSKETSLETFEELFEWYGSDYGAMESDRFLFGAAGSGGLAGPGALIYAAGSVARCLRDGSVQDEASRQLDLAAAHGRSKGVGVDLAFGLAGLQLSLLKLRSAVGIAGPTLDSLIAYLASRLGDALADQRRPPGSALGGERLRELVPVDRDGVALALVRTLAVAPELVGDPSSLVGALADHTFNRQVRGGRLAAMAVHAIMMSRAWSAPAKHRLIAAEISQLSTRALILRAEEAQLASRHLHDGEAADEALRCIREILDRRSASGRWFPDRLVDDRLNLSGLDGVPALGIVLLRHLRPELPSISLLE